MNLPIKQTILSIVDYLEKQGLVVSYDELYTHIISTQNLHTTTKKKKPFKIKSKANKKKKDTKKKNSK